jgi:hypothetical protein
MPTYRGRPTFGPYNRGDSLARGLILWQPVFRGSTASNIGENIATGIDATSIGSATNVVPMQGSGFGLSLPGSLATGFLQISLPGAVQFVAGAAGFSMSAWVQFYSLSGNQAVIVVSDASGTSGGAIELRSGTITFNYGGVIIVDSSVSPVIGTLYHVVASSGGGVSRLTVNGVTASSSVSPGSGTCSLVTVGKYPQVGSDYDAFTGNIGNIKVWNRALSLSEVQRDYGDGWILARQSSSALLTVPYNRLGPGNSPGCEFSAYNIFPTGNDGDAISALIDKSGSANTATANGVGLVLKTGVAKIGSMNVLRGDGAHLATLSEPISGSHGLTLLVVGRRTPGTKWYPFGASAQNSLLGISNDDNVYAVDSNNTYVSTQFTNSSSFLCYWTVSPAGLVKFRGGGKALTTLGTIGAQSFSCILGRLSDYTSSTSDHAAIVVFSRELSATELAAEWQALATLAGFDLDGAAYPSTAVNLMALASYIARRRRFD